MSEREVLFGEEKIYVNFIWIGKLDLGNVKHIYRFEPNPFIPELALQMSNLTRLANYLRSDEYREIYQNYFLNFDDNETKEITKKTNKKNKIVMLKNK